jgi:transaldolase
MNNEMSFEEKIRKQIREERARERNRTIDEICNSITRGEIEFATGHLLFHTPSEQFANKLQTTLDKIDSLWNDTDRSGKSHILRFLVKLSIDLESFLPKWNLAKKIDENGLSTTVSTVRLTLDKLERISRDIQREIVGDIEVETLVRLKAEGLTDQEAAAESAKLLSGGSLAAYSKALSAEIRQSNLLAAANPGSTETELGNDYAAFLQYMIWLGGSFVTTNPVLIKVAWDTDPVRWDARVDDLIRSRYNAKEISDLLSATEHNLQQAITSINSLVTMSVVEENCRLLRDIFLVSEGTRGYVSLQVNPENHDDGAQMASEAKDLYDKLKGSLGGVPNVVFKLPATSAGLKAAKELTSEGIGVTITVSYSVFQAVDFGKVLSEGKALVTYIALMNGRMAFPVRDELKRIGTKGGEEASRWAGVEVARKSYHRLYDSADLGGLGIDPSRVKLLIASLRIYDDWLPDISELWGCPVITFFPNVRRKYDSHSRGLDGSSVLNETPPNDVDTLMQSEIFRQAWWLPGDSKNQCPEKILKLTDTGQEDLITWEPVANTMKQFIELYNQMGEMVKERLTKLATEIRGA